MLMAQLQEGRERKESALGADLFCFYHLSFELVIRSGKNSNSKDILDKNFNPPASQVLAFNG